MADFDKDPDAVLDYVYDWEEWLGSDTISTSTFLISGPDSDLTEDSKSHTDTAATVWLSGGTTGVAYKVTNRIVTAEGRTADRTAVFRINDK